MFHYYSAVMLVDYFSSSVLILFLPSAFLEALDLCMILLILEYLYLHSIVQIKFVSWIALVNNYELMLFPLPLSRTHDLAIIYDIWSICVFTVMAFAFLPL
jgi:hypothetical protein